MKYLKNFSLFENVSQSKSILKSLGKDVNDDDYKKIREILVGHDGYVGWFTNLHYKKGYSLNQLLDLYDIIKTNTDYITKLDKPLIKYDSIESLQDDIESIRLKSSYGKILGEFPNRQSSFLKDSDKTLLQNLSTRKDNKSFFKKIASYHNRKDMIDGLKAFLSIDPTANLDKVMKEAKSSGADIIHHSYENNILIVRVYNSSQLNKIAGDCSWCIRSQSTFDSYVRDQGKQFIIFLFDKIDNMSRIGVTADMSSKNFFKTAHNKVDGGVGYNTLKDLLNMYDVDVNDILKYKLSDININNTPVSRLMDTFGLSKEEIIKLKDSYKPNDLSMFSKEEIDKWNLLDKSEINLDTLMKYSFDEVITKKMVLRLNHLSIRCIISMYKKYGYKVIDYFKKNISLLNSVYGEIYHNDVNDRQFIKKEIIDGKAPKNSWDLEIGSSWSDKDRYSYERSLFKMLWFRDDIKKYMINKKWPSGHDFIIKDLFIKESSGSMIEFIKDLGIKPKEVLELISGDRFNFNFEYYKQLIKWYKEDGIDHTEVVSKLFNIIRGRGIDDWEMKSYIESKFFSKKQIDELIEIRTNREFSKAIPTSAYNREMSKSYAVGFYDKWNETLDKRLPLRGYNSDEKIAGIIILYTKLNKLEELEKFNIKFEGNSGQRPVGELTDMITGMYRTNGGMKEDFTKEECKRLYKFLTTKCDLSDLSLGLYSVGDNKTEEARERDNRYYYLPAMYLYDRNAFDNYLMYEVSNIKYNKKKDKVFVPARGDKNKSETNRISEITPVFQFLYTTKKEVDPSSVDELIDTLISFGLSLLEVKSIFHVINNLRNHYSRRRDTDAKIILSDSTKKLLLDTLYRKTSSEKIRNEYKSMIKPV